MIIIFYFGILNGVIKVSDKPTSFYHGIKDIFVNGFHGASIVRGNGGSHPPLREKLERISDDFNFVELLGAKAPQFGDLR